MSQCSEFWEFTVNSPPTIAQKLLEETIVGEKEDIELVVKVDCHPPPTVKWFKDGVEIHEKDSHIKITSENGVNILKIHGANRNDTAVYSVQFTNEHGTTKDETKVHVKCAPQIKTQLKNIVVNEGDKNVELSVTVDGYPK